MTQLEKSSACLLILFAIPGVGLAAEAPVAVSPGDASRLVLVEGRCPTFSWGDVEGANSYELIVYRIGAEAEELDPVLQRSFPGSVETWTPSLEQCVERGGQYTWTVRAVIGEGFTDWSVPMFFEVISRPSGEEIAEALGVIRRYLAKDDERNDLEHDSAGVLESFDAAEPGLEPYSSPVALGSEAIGTAELTVEGEVRTVDGSGEPRLWGRGRPGTIVYSTFNVGPLQFTCSNGDIKFGLSRIAVPWGSAAEACPAGTWVCRFSSIGACDTNRPDGLNDSLDCSGAPQDRSPDKHVGWLAGQTGTTRGRARREDQPQVTGLFPPCMYFPAWCCWN